MRKLHAYARCQGVAGLESNVLKVAVPHLLSWDSFDSKGLSADKHVLTQASELLMQEASTTIAPLTICTHPASQAVAKSCHYPQQEMLNGIVQRHAPARQNTAAYFAVRLQNVAGAPSLPPVAGTC